MLNVKGRSQKLERNYADQGLDDQGPRHHYGRHLPDQSHPHHEGAPLPAPAGGESGQAGGPGHRPGPEGGFAFQSHHPGRARIVLSAGRTAGQRNHGPQSHHHLPGRHGGAGGATDAGTHHLRPAGVGRRRQSGGHYHPVGHLPGLHSHHRRPRGRDAGRSAPGIPPWRLEGSGGPAAAKGRGAGEPPDLLPRPGGK